MCEACLLCACTKFVSNLEGLDDSSSLHCTPFEVGFPDENGHRPRNILCIAEQLKWCDLEIFLSQSDFAAKVTNVPMSAKRNRKQNELADGTGCMHHELYATYQVAWR